MKPIIFSFVFLALTACTSHKPPMPKGAWVAVNQAGFIPVTVTKYRDSVETLPQEIDVADKTKEKLTTEISGSE